MVLILTAMKTTNSVCRLQKEPASVDEGAMVASPDKTHPRCAVARNCIIRYKASQAGHLHRYLFPNYKSERAR